MKIAFHELSTNVGLLPRLLSGKIRVKDAEKFAEAVS